MKLLTISIAAYNVEKYLEKCLSSFNDERFRKDIEVLIVDDGSQDKTRQIAEKYQEKWPQTFKYIHKRNGGHGSTINKGIELATGKYFRVLDGDDWVNPDNFYLYIQKLQSIDSDMVLTQHTEVSPTKQKVISLIKNLDEGRKYSLADRLDIQRVTLHMVTIKTKLLKENNVKITENCFYVDVEYVVWSIFLAKTLIYYKIPVYMYRIGNSNQSVNKKNMLKNVAMQEKVSYQLIFLYERFIKLNKLEINKEKIIYRTIKKSVGSTIRTYLLLDSTKESKNKIVNFEKEIRNISDRIYNQLNEDIFISVIRKRNYSLIPFLKFLYKVWCLRYAG